jgi:hypothetical protein
MAGRMTARKRKLVGIRPCLWVVRTHGEERRAEREFFVCPGPATRFKFS